MEPHEDPGRTTAEDMGLPHQRALFDFDPRRPGRNVLSGDAEDLSAEEMEAVRSFITKGTLVTIYARAGDGQDMAQFLSVREDLIAVASAYAEHCRKEGGPEQYPDFRLRPLSAGEKRNIEAATGHTLREEYRH